MWFCYSFNLLFTHQIPIELNNSERRLANINYIYDLLLNNKKKF